MLQLAGKNDYNIFHYMVCIKFIIALKIDIDHKPINNIVHAALNIYFKIICLSELFEGEIYLLDCLSTWLHCCLGISVWVGFDLFRISFIFSTPYLHFVDVLSKFASPNISLQQI